ncbi:hypothetical protein [Halomarina oriensis]|uniref:DUF1102 domain-containing protein n=1 Tax=Halomarina oriensis TaxID=671145 RepID=A0A6B0GFR5_9EURY|nr:hypothetical protein [Halomarina oriensis]MWG33544.1 hypothetical protein [Halomarina oriensis]
MERRRFLLGVGSLAAAGTAAMGTGAFEGAYINGDRSMTVDLESDSGAYLSLIPTSPYASEEPVSGGWEGGQGVSQLAVTFDRLNPNMDSRFDDVFRVQNTTGAPVTLTIDDSPDWNGGYEDTLQIFAQPSGGGSPTRLDDGGSVELGPGEYVEINFVFLFATGPNDGNPNGFTKPDTLTITADGTDSNA